MQGFLDLLSRLQQRHALLLFLALGAFLFSVDAGRGRIAPLQAPEVLESAQSAQQWLEDEVLYREALARGLDEGDLIVRRRLVQKMRQLLDAGVDVAEPGEAQLRAWIDAHAARYGALTRLSLQHVFLSRGRHGARLAERAAQVGKRLSQDAASAPDRLSDPHPAGTRVQDLDSRGIERLFGSALAAHLAELPQGAWQGPLLSSLGLHYVRISARELHAPDYDAVRERALREFLVERRREQTQVSLDRLKAQYGLNAATVP